jgi:uncharacterized protein (DUF2141 family)
MRKAAILFVFCATIIGTNPASAQPSYGEACGQARGPAFLIKANGLKDRSGRVIAELYPANEADFLKDKDALLRDGKLFRRVEAPVPQQGPVNLCIDAPKPGAYALVFIHDRDGKNKFNIWKDGIGLPGGQTLGTSRPRVSQATVTTGGAAVSVPVNMQYMHGASGFSARRE